MTFEQFAMARLPSLLRYAVVLTGDRDLAQDVIQVVLARAQVRWRRITGDDPEAYVRRMMLDEYLSWRRFWAARRLRSAGVTVGVDDDGAEMNDVLWNRLRTLGRKQRAVLVLRHYERMEDDQIAALLGCSVATVRSHASRALKTLRLEPELNDRILVKEKS